MSILKNLLNQFMPHAESRRSSANLASLNAALTHDVDGDSNAIIYIDGTGTLNATYILEGSPDGIQWYNLIGYPYAPHAVGGTIPISSQPIFTEAVNAASIKRTICANVAQLRKIRIRLSAYVSGNAAITITTDASDSLNAYVTTQKASTLLATITAAASAAATLTLPAVAGLRHYIDWIQIVRSATVLLTASATPTIITTTNLPGALAATMGASADPIGTDKVITLDFGSVGLAATGLGVATTIVAPVSTGSIWRITASYRLGI